MKKQRLITGILAIFLLTGFGITATAGDLDAFKDLSGSLKISGGTAHIPVMKVAA